PRSGRSHGASIERANGEPNSRYSHNSMVPPVGAAIPKIDRNMIGATDNSQRRGEMAMRPNGVVVDAMSWVIGGAVVCATLVVAGCMTVTRLQPEEPAPPIEVRISAPAAEAFRRTLSAFAADGLTVAQAEESGGVIASAPVAGDMMLAGRLED